MRKVAQGPKFIRYFGAVIQALKQLGGSGRAAEVVELVARIKNVSEAEQQELLVSGSPRFDNQVHFCRQYLVWAGYLDSSRRGVWNLTEKGLATTDISHPEALQIFKQQHALHTKPTAPAEKTEEEEETIPRAEDYKEQLLNLIRAIPPEGFERLCQRLLRESGFEKVTVTGGPRDQGIDGIGILQVNPFVSFKVLFQCKRYSGSVTRSQVGDFRNSMLGRADKGIIITTGSFTADARTEAGRDGAPPIELVDGQKLIEMFENLELGLTPKKTYEVDEHFFDEFRVPATTKA